MASSRTQLLSATCLATVTMPSARPAYRDAAAGSLFRPVPSDTNRAVVLAAASVVSLVAGAMASPAQAAYVQFSTTDPNGAFTAAAVGGSLLVGDSISGGLGYTYIDGSSFAVTMTAKNVSGSTVTFSGSESLSWLSLNGVTTSSVSNNSSDNFDVRINPNSLTRGAFAGAFTFKATKTGGGGASETATIKVSGIAVAPVASTSGDTTVYALAGSGGTTKATVTTTNIGDGNLSGLGSSSNLSAATNARSTTTGWTGTTSNTTSSGDGASRTVGTYTYTAQSTRQSNTTTITSSFSNGNPDGTNTSATLTTTLTGVTVAPVQSVTTTGTTLYALPGQKATGSFNIQNVGDGSYVGTTLNGTITTTPTTGLTGSVANGNFNLNDGKTGPAATSVTQTLTYTGQATRGNSVTATVTASFSNGDSSGDNSSQSVTQTYKAQTVAPVASVASTVSFGTVRAGGTSTSQTLTVQNKGDGNLAGKTSDYNLRGTVGGASGNFAGTGGALNGSTGLNDSTYGAGATTSANYTFTYAPTTRGVHSTSVTTSLQNGVGNGNASGSVTTTLSGTAVGPVYEAKQNSAAISNYGTVSFTSYGGANLQYKDLMISNITSDTPAGNLTDLTLSFSIIGDPTNEFSISLNGSSYGSTASFVSSAGGLASMIANISIQFNNKVSGGDGFAQLQVSTDEGAAFGGAGAIYIYNLAAVPEPGTIMILGTGLLGFAIARRRRRGAGNEAVRLTARDEDHPPA